MRQKMQKWSLIGLVILLTLSLTGCGFCGLPICGRLSRPAPTPTVVGQVQPKPIVPTPTPLPAEIIREADAEELLLINVYKRVNPSVVHIRVVQRISSEGFTFPQIPGFPNIPQSPEEFYQEGTGSGFVIDKEGHIVTNNHVVENAEDVQVTFHDGTAVHAKVIGTDPDSDLAVIKVDVPADMLHPVELGDSDQLEVGQRAIALGNPFGLRGTLTTGIISALGRSLPLGRASVVIGARFTIPELIQTDAAINPGNSGGPLLDSQGRVIGVNTAYNPSTSGIGFAVPVNTVKRVVPKLIKDGYYPYPWLGISGTDLSLDIIEEMKLPVQRGAIILEVTPDSPAEKAGLRGSTKTVKKAGREVRIGGDVIIAIDGQKVEQFEDILVYILRHTEVGQEVKLTIIRDGKEQSVRVKLGERPKE
ncbi:MAG: trypsin-like peptidase domain-containing protein [Candidatus Hadarchaeum sp.]